jgi:RNA polymerase sigma-70 factor (ECF subfamily)
MGNGRFTSEREAAMIAAMEASLPSLRSFARGLCSSEIVADDIVQSACERALERLDQVTDIGGMKSWLNRIVYTQWQDMLRQRQRRKRNLLSFWDYKYSGSRERQEREGEAGRILKIDMARALDRLSEEHRAAVVLVSMLGCGYEEASAILEIPVGTVASRVARARMLLAEYLGGADRKSTSTPLMKEIVR